MEAGTLGSAPGMEELAKYLCRLPLPTRPSLRPLLPLASTLGASNTPSLPHPTPP